MACIFFSISSGVLANLCSLCLYTVIDYMHTVHYGRLTITTPIVTSPSNIVCRHPYLSLTLKRDCLNGVGGRVGGWGVMGCGSEIPMYTRHVIVLIIIIV